MNKFQEEEQKFINLLLKYGVNATKMNKNINYNLLK